MVCIEFDFQPMKDLEYVLSKEFTPANSGRQWVTISKEEASELYYVSKSGRVSVYIPTGAQKGDEAKGKATESIAALDPRVVWGVSTDSCSNAGKGFASKTSSKSKPKAATGGFGGGNTKTKSEEPAAESKPAFGASKTKANVPAETESDTDF